MALTKKEILKIADLAKLNISDRQAQDYSKELGAVLAYVDKIKQLDLAQVPESLSGVQQSPLFLRKDEAGKSDRDLIAQAKNEKAGFVVVPNVFNKKNG